MKNIVENARKIATDAHKDQKRKFGSQEPYIVHPTWVANKAKEIGCNEVEQAASFLHDVLEDVAIPTNSLDYWQNLIKEECGEDVLALVWELTDPSDTREWKDLHPNPRRSEKWETNLAHIRVISDTAKRLKMVDRLANILTMDGAPSRMKAKYIPESRELMYACRYADEQLGKELERAIDSFERNI